MYAIYSPSTDLLQNGTFDSIAKAVNAAIALNTADDHAISDYVPVRLVECGEKFVELPEAVAAE
jgi:hypothetical protein